jgi:hypothetical protein
VRADLFARLSVAARTAIGVGTSQHWFPSSEDKVPLKAWAEARARPGEPMDWCAAATGLPYHSGRLWMHQHSAAWPGLSSHAITPRRFPPPPPPDPPSLPSDAAAYAQGHNRARGNLATELLATTRQHRPGRYSAELFGAFAIRSSCSPAISSREVGTEQKIQILSRTEGSSI